MCMPTDYELTLMHAIREREFAREMRRDRLAREVRGPGWWVRALAAAGGGLVAVGSRLQRPARRAGLPLPGGPLA